MNKVVISGHCNGIGKAIASKLLSRYKVCGYDLLRGQDITNKDTFASFLDECFDANIIVLNAHTTKQHEELLAVYNAFKDEDKHCIIIGSLVTKLLHRETKIPATYVQEKLQIEKVFQKIFNRSNRLKISIVRPHFVKTELSKDFRDDNSDDLLPEEVADVVSYIIKSNRLISSIDLI
jgi:NADP-dependent 3-hydroxy acid dehydrogenase YdfG